MIYSLQSRDVEYSKWILSVDCIGSESRILKQSLDINVKIMVTFLNAPFGDYEILNYEGKTIE